MNFFTITCIITFITNLFIAILFLLKVKSKSIGKNFGWTSLASFTWAFGALFSSVSNSIETATFWLKIAHIGIILTPTFFIHFVITFTNSKAKFLRIFVYFLSTTYLLLNFFYPNFYEVKFVFNQFYFFQASFAENPIYTIYYVTFYWCTLLYAFFLLLKFFTKTTGKLRNQVKYFLIGMFVAWSGPEGMFLLVFGLPLYPVTNLLIAAYPLILAYAILKYRLMDINIALTRLGIFIFVYSFVLGLPFWVGIKFLGKGPWLIPTGICVALATAGPFVYLFLQRKAENALLQEDNRIQDLLNRASMGMRTVRNVPKLLEVIVDILSKSLRLENAVIYLHEPLNDEYVFKKSSNGQAINVNILKSDPLIQKLEETKYPIVLEELKLSAELKGKDENLSEIIRQMGELQASVIIPTVVENVLLGFIVLGKSKDARIYSMELINVLLIVGNNAALAIENAMFIEESEKNLAQRSHETRLKAIGAMGSGVAHQIRNRFNIMSGHTSAFIAMLKKIDLSNQPKEKLVELVEKAKKTMEKILENTMQGEKICVAINSYSKLTEEKEFAEFGSIIEMAVDLLRGRIDFDKLELVKDFPDNVKIYGVIPMIQDVFVNLIVNSRDAMQSKLNYIKRGEWSFPDYAPRITIKGTVNKDKLVVDFSDNGTGFKPEDEQNAFVPFYTTKGTGIKGKDGGTGLGLHLIWDFLKKNNGDLQLINKYQEGVTFRITLPLAKNERES